MPYLRLREQFQIGGETPAIEQIVIARVNDQRIGFTVDAVIGGHQTVIKNLGKFYHNVEGISGATILGDGTVALILDAQKLVAGLEHHGMRALNCWEFKKCGRERGGAKSKELGVCLVYPTQGRHCAQVAGSLCGGTVQGTFAKKLFNCSQCDFSRACTTYDTQASPSTAVVSCVLRSNENGSAQYIEVMEGL